MKQHRRLIIPLILFGGILLFFGLWPVSGQTTDLVQTYYLTSVFAPNSETVYIEAPNTIKWDYAFATSSGYFAISKSNGSRIFTTSQPKNDTSGYPINTSGSYIIQVCGGAGTGEAMYSNGTAQGKFWFSKKVAGKGYSVRYMEDISGSSSVHNGFFMYLPTAAEPKAYDQKPIGKDDRKTVTTLSGTFRYKVRVKYSYKYYYSQTFWTPPKPYFKIHKCDASGNGVAQLVYVSGGQSGTVDIDAGYGLRAFMDNGHRQGLFGEDRGSYRCLFELNYRLDEAAPQIPTLNAIPTTEAVLYNGVYYTKNNSINMSWNPVTDNGTVFEGLELKSGVTHYIVERNESPGLTGINPNKVLGGDGAATEITTSTSVNLPVINRKYYLRVRSQDLEENISAPSNEVIVMVDNVGPTNPGIPSANNLEQSQYTKSTNLTWQWTAATDAASGLNEYKYRIYKEGTTPGTWNPTTATQVLNYNAQGGDGKYICEVQAFDRAGNYSDIQKGSVIVDTQVAPVTISSSPFQYTGTAATIYWNPVTDQSNIALYEAVLTENPNPPGTGVAVTTVNPSNLKCQFTNLSPTHTYYGWVRAKDGVGNVSNTWSRVGPIPNFTFTGPSGTLIYNTKLHTFNVQPSPVVTGKEIRYRVCYQGNGNTIREEQFQKDSRQIQFPGDGVWNWWLEIQEYSGSTPEGYVHTTKTKTFSIDTEGPGGAFSIRAEDGITNLALTPTNTEKVKIIPGNINDDLGIVHSGVKGFYLWNGDIDERPAGVSLITDFHSSVNWTLPGGDGEKRVNMEIIDNAGNRTLEKRWVTLDKTPPTAPANFSHTHSENPARKITYNWSSPSTDIQKFVGSFLLPNGIYAEQSFVATPASGSGFTSSFELSVPSGGNQPVYLTIQAVDKAGNVSGQVTYVTYTPAIYGTLSNITSGYNTSDGHYFTGSLTGGRADHQIIQLCKDQQFTNDVMTLSATNGQFKATHLDAHGTYYYRVVAFNSPSTINGAVQGDAEGTTTENPSVYTVPYIPPNTFDIAAMKPNGFATTTGGINEDIKLQFDYEPIQTVDNDPVSYQVYWAEGTNPAPASFQAAALEGGHFTLTLPRTAHGQAYTWFVRATITYNSEVLDTIDSPVIHFTVDINPPQIDQLVRPGGEYTNQDAVAIAVHDDASGIAKVAYKKSNETVQTAITLTPPADNSPTGAWTGNIPLPEGEYNLEVYVYDNSGNITSDTTTLYNMKVDRTSQSPTGVQILLNTLDGRYVSSGMVPVSWTVTESGIQGFYYWLVKQLPVDLNTLPLGMDNFVNNTGTLVMNATLPLTGATGESFYLVMASKDQANNLSNKYVSPSQILLDKTPPSITDLAISGFIRGGSSFYLANPASLTLDHFLAGEDVSEVTTRKYAILETTTGVEQTILNWTANWADVQGTVLVNGKKYRIKGQAANIPGLVSEIASFEFVFDNSAPSNIQISGPTGALMTGETAIFTVGATGTYSPIVAYYLAIGSENGGTDVTSRIPGNQNGWMVLPTNNSTGTIRIELPAMSNGTFYPVVKVKNAAGIESQIVTGSQFTINNNQNKMVVHDQGPYTSVNDRLTGWWENYHNATGYKYRILGPNQAVVYPWHTTQEALVTVQESGLTFESGTQYQFEVKALFDGGESASGFSPGVTVDTSIPEITQLTTDDYSTTWNLKLAWNGHDDQSGIARVQVAVGTSPNASDVSNGYLDVIGNTAWISCDTNGQKLQLSTNTRYYLTLRLTNGAGLVNEMPGSCVVIDDTVPPVPIVVDQGKYINTNANQPMEAQWLWSGTDPDSGNLKYEWAIIESPDEVDAATWHDVGMQTQVTLSMNDFTRVDTKNYYFAIRVTNGAGLTNIGFSDGILVDGEAPLIPRVKLLQGVNLDPATAADVNYIANLNNLSLAIKSWASSGITQVQYAWGTAGEVENEALQLQDTSTSETVVTLNDDQITTLYNSDFLETGPYTTIHKRLYFLAKTLSGANNLSAPGYSAGVVLENGAPAITGVNGYCSGDQYRFDWNLDLGESISPLDHYVVALVASQDLNGDPSQWTWTSTGTIRKYQIAVEDIPEGQYYLVIRGVNCANIASRRELNEWGISPLITIDNTPPVISQFTYPQLAANQLQIHVEAADQGTGIGGYQYAIGTLTNYQDISNGWVDINRQDGVIDYIIDTANVTTNTPVYVTVRAKDRAGNWTIPGNTSQAILVDHTPPTTPVVTCGSYTNTRLFISGITFNSSDPESQVTHYQIGIVPSTASQLNSQLPLQPITGFDGRCVPGFNLAEGAQYYIAVRTYNGAGLASAIGYSSPFTVDVTPPILTFAKANEMIVVNPITEAEPAVNVQYWLSENANIILVQTADDGTFKTATFSGIAGPNGYEFRENKPQIYTLTVIPTDGAGNTGNTKSQQIRVNAPPEITIAEQFYATPNQPLNITATVIDTDSIAGDTIQYSLDPGDGTGLLYGTATLAQLPGGTISCGISVTHSYQNITQENQVYPVKLIITDQDGGIAIADDSTVKIGNTQSGTLSGDEIWSGEHHLYGTVTVPANIHLTITPNTRVIIDGVPGSDGYDIALIVHGTLTVGNNVSFDSKEGALDNGVITNRWKGIRIDGGTAVLNGATVKHALRAIAVKTSNTVTITGCTFNENYVGLHVYQSTPVVSGCHFTNNQWYGIKEDQGGRPRVTTCGFGGNEINYYQEQVTRITLDALNQLGENTGNYLE